MPINVDLTETQNPETAGQFQRIPAGPVHLMVIEAKENGGDKGEHVVKLEVLMHADQNYIGKTHTEWFPASAKMAWKLLSFCYAVKIADREAMGRQKATGNSYVPIDLKAAEGRQLFGTIKVTEKDGKAFHNLDDMMAIDDPKADKHPRNPGMLNQALGGQPRAVSPATTSAGAPNGVTQQPSAAAASNPFASLT